MADINDGGPAFGGSYDQVLIVEGRPDLPAQTIERRVSGMSLRDHFAGQALAGVILHPNATDGSPTRCAEVAYKMADAMLKARATDHA